MSNQIHNIMGAAEEQPRTDPATAEKSQTGIQPSLIFMYAGTASLLLDRDHDLDPQKGGRNKR